MIKIGYLVPSIGHIFNKKFVPFTTIEYVLHIPGLYLFLELTDGYSQIERRLLEQSYINELAPSLNCFNALGLNQDKLRDKYRRYYIKH